VGTYNQEIGRWGEELAGWYLQQKGYHILAKNYRTAYGEIDLVALEKVEGESFLVFVEVKTRTSESFGYPEQALTRRKWDHLLASINQFQDDHPEIDHDWRVDVIAIQRLSVGDDPDFEHYENVVISDGEY
jgi:putative endonuclease